jgi:predicted O-linked N-acetylglucosamine transferase (SPINDLY family)
MTAAARSVSPDPQAELAAARKDIFSDRPIAALARLETLVAADPSDPLVSYWRAAALGAAGRWDEHRQVLTDAQMLHAFRIIQGCGVDLGRLQADPALAAQVADIFYAQNQMGAASAAGALAASRPGAPVATLLRYGLSLQHQGRIEEAVRVFKTTCEAYPGLPDAHSFLLYSLFYVPDGVARHAEAARRWAHAFDGLPTSAGSSYSNPALAGRALKLGYVLPTVTGGQARQFLLPVLENHDPSRVEVHLYLRQAEKDAVLPAHAVHAIGELSDDQAADQIRRDGIDLLVDLWGHTAHGRLGVFARRPAPVQASWLNYVQTTGLAAIDYLIHADCMAVPGAQDHCAETIWSLGPIICPFRPDPRPEPTPAPALQAGFVTFGSYNHPARMNDATVAAWSAILARTPGSRLLLRYAYYVDPVLQNATLMRFAARGIEPERIQFGERLAQPDYYRSYAEIDLALDPSPNPGGTTSLDAVANGVPLLTLAGPDYFSRIGIAVVGPLGLDELVAHDWDDYVERAVALAREPPALDALRVRVRAAFDASGRVDEAGFTRRLEAAFRDMFSRWHEGGRA